MAARRVGKILPPNATALELNLLEAGNRFPLLRQSVPLITTAKLIDLPDSFLPWLIDEYGLEPFVQFYGGDRRRAIREGVPLTRKLGTPYAVKTLLGLSGFPGSGLEEEPAGGAHWFEFQAALPSVPQSLDTITKVEEAITLGKGFSRRLSRMYAGLDVRPVMLDEAFWEDSLLDDYSGIRLDPNGPVLSFGEVFEFLVRLPEGSPKLGVALSESQCVVAMYDDVFRLDQGILEMDDTGLVNPFSIGVIASFIGIEDRPPTRTPDVQTIVKAMVVGDTQHLFGDINMTFARSQVIESGELMFLDDGKFETTGITAVEVPIDELIEQVVSGTIAMGGQHTIYSLTTDSREISNKPDDTRLLLDGGLPDGGVQFADTGWRQTHDRDMGRTDYRAQSRRWLPRRWPQKGASTWASYGGATVVFDFDSADNIRRTTDTQVRVTTDDQPRLLD